MYNSYHKSKIEEIYKYIKFLIILDLTLFSASMQLRHRNVIKCGFVIRRYTERDSKNSLFPANGRILFHVSMIDRLN